MNWLLIKKFSLIRFTVPRLREWTVLLLLVLTSSCMAKHEDLDDELDSILEGSVPFISASGLHGQLNRPGTVVLDIRTEREQEISHIPGARMLSFEDFREENVADISRQDTLVLYCAVGYRSEKIGERLQEMGFQHVYNLYGGIFEWKNEGYEVINNQGLPTDSVHTYNEDWSKYLKQGTKVYD